MEIQTKVNSLGILALLVAMLFCGCNSVIFPETNRTNDRDGEYVVINMLNFSQMADYKSEYKAVFGHDLKEIDVLKYGFPKDSDKKSMGSNFAAEAGSKLLANIIDFIVEESKRGLQEEASYHIANYGTQIAKDNFWKSDSTNKTLMPSYYGFKVTRYTSKHGSTKPASKLVFGLYPAKGNATMFLTAPLYMEVASVKAKTTDWKWFSFFPLFWYQFGMANYSQTVNVNAEITVTGVTVDEKYIFTEQELLNSKISLPPVDLKAVNASGGVIITAYEPGKSGEKTKKTYNDYRKKYQKLKMPPQTLCWWLSPRISKRKIGAKTYYGWGAFYLKVVVTEEDASECKNYIKKVVSGIDANKDAIKQQIVNVYSDAIKKNTATSGD